MITSPQNQRIKYVRALQGQGKTRRRERRFVLEGARLITDALEAGSQPDFLMYVAEAVSPDKPGHALLEQARALGVECLEITPELLAEIADTQTPAGLLAVVAMPDYVPPSTIRFGLILDSIRDPGNLGTILRTGAAAGVDAILIGPACADPYNPKAVRAGAGAHLRVPLYHGDWDDIRRWCGETPIYLADAGGDVQYDHIDWRAPAALVVGSESHGPGAESRALSRRVIAVPMANAAESLNAAAAAAVILFEAARQRR